MATWQLGLTLALMGCSGGDSNRPPPFNPDPDAGVDTCDTDQDGHEAVSCGGDDCDDGNELIHPGAAENPCLDMNCDGHGGPDADGDSHLSDQCGGDDCDDEDAASYPGAVDMVGVGGDEDCDGLDGVDADGDRSASVASGGDDCDDANADVNPEATDMFGDGQDANCDGIDGVDADDDGVPSDVFGGDDCNDDDATVYPGAADQFGDGRDQNCDGIDGVDADGDGYASVASGGDDCNEGDPDIHPNAQGDWVWETLSTSMRGDPPVPALDSNGDVHVAYIEEDDIGINQIILANNANGAWEFETVGPSPHCVALALDASDAVHLVYRNAGEIPQYATNASGAWVFEPIGGTSAIANCTVGVAPDGVVHTIFSTDALAVTHGHRSPDDWLFEEVALGEVDTSDVSFRVVDRRIVHVAYSDNRGVHYVANTTPGYAETNEAAGGPGGTAPFALAEGDTLVVSVDSGAPQTLTFAAGSFVDITRATATELAAAINAQLVGAQATVVANSVRITSSSQGPLSVIEIGGGSTAIDGGKLDMNSGIGSHHTGGDPVQEDLAPGQTAFLALWSGVPAIIYQGVPRMFYAERTGPQNAPWVRSELPWDSVSPHLTFASDGRRHAAFGDVATGNVDWARSADGALWASEAVQPVAGTETVGRVLMTPGDEPVFFIVEVVDDETSLHFVERGPVDGVDQDCDGRVR